MAKIMTERPRDPKERAAHAALKKKKPLKPPKHLLALEKGPLGAVVALLFWKLRHQVPDFAVVIEEADIAAFKQSLDYGKQQATVVVQAVAPRAGYAYLTIRLSDQAGDPIVGFENNEGDLRQQQTAKELRRLKEQVPMMVSTVKNEFNVGTTSQDSIDTLCAAAMAMARS